MSYDNQIVDADYKPVVEGAHVWDHGKYRGEVIAYVDNYDAEMGGEDLTYSATDLPSFTVRWDDGSVEEVVVPYSWDPRYVGEGVFKCDEVLVIAG